jgi:xanthine phosphoribosyltransferase
MAARTQPTPGAAALHEAIVRHGRVEGSLVKVDDFLNHRIDPGLLDLVGGDLAERWAGALPDLVLTAEASGIAPALTTAHHLGVSVVFAKKYPRSVDRPRPAFTREVSSPTKGNRYLIEIARRMIPEGSRVLIVDDFLSRGRTAEALAEIVEEAGASLVALAFVIEKAFEPGRDLLTSRGWRVDSLIRILDIEGGLTLEATSGAGTGTG